jgi:hypothetical protein
VAPGTRRTQVHSLSRLEKGNPLKTTNIELGAVSSRVALLLRSAEAKPWFSDLFHSRNTFSPFTFYLWVNLLAPSQGSVRPAELGRVLTRPGPWSGQRRASYLTVDVCQILRSDLKAKDFDQRRSSGMRTD